MNAKKHVSSDGNAVAREFAFFFERLVDEKYPIAVALSGGSTPKLLFDILASDFKDKIDWTRIHFYWGDERCVPPDDLESNYKMTFDHLFQKVNIPEENVHRVRGEYDPRKEAIRYSEHIESNLNEAHGLPRFDLIILGMGEDGHTASIFPHEMELLTANATCAVATHPVSGQKRITLTGPVINNAAIVAFLVTGETKRGKVDEILNQGVVDYPAARIQPTDGELHWFLDESAVGRQPF